MVLCVERAPRVTKHRGTRTFPENSNHTSIRTSKNMLSVTAIQATSFVSCAGSARGCPHRGALSTCCTMGCSRCSPSTAVRLPALRSDVRMQEIAAEEPATFNPKTFAQSLPGISGPLGFFDPLGFSSDESATEGKIRFYREVEVKHAYIRSKLAAILYALRNVAIKSIRV